MTILNSDFLYNELGIRTGLEAQRESAKFKDYYSIICAFVRENNIAKPNAEMIEDFLETGRLGSQVSRIKSAEKRKELFLRAQAKQLEYEMTSGVSDLIAERARQDLRISQATIDALEELDILKPHWLLKR